MFRTLARVPDHPALELEILDWWEERGTFDQLREQNRGGPVWSFVDGPVTANKTLAIHTAWGRTLKDVFQRYKALQGFDQRYQNGFDCQGLWIEVGVERELGLNSKREIEEYGLAEFARKCREKVVWSATEITRGSKRLGQWMDWGNDYFTFSDTNIEYIWRFLRKMHDDGQLYMGHRSTEWCPRCGTSISAHELVGSYEDRTDPSLFVRFPLLDRPGQSLAVWTTTPWTLPANVAAAVNPEAEYGRRENGEWVRGRPRPARGVRRARQGRRARRPALRGPVRPPRRRCRAIEHRVIPWDEVSLEEGTGIVHIAPGCGAEDFELSRVHDLPVLVPVDEAGRFYPDFGWLHGQGTAEAAEQIVVDLAERGRLIAAERDRASLPLLLALPHAAHLPHRRRLVHRRRRAAPAARRRQRDRQVDARLLRQAHGGLAPEHGGLEHLAPALLRPAAAHLPLRLRPRDRDRVEGRAGGEGDRRPGRARGAAPPLDRRRHRSAARPAATRRSGGSPRSATSGSTRASCPSRPSAGRTPSGSSMAMRPGPPRAYGRGPPRPRVLGDLVPRRLGLGDARADPPLVLLAALHVGGARRPRAVPGGARLREDARRARPGDARLVGEHDRRRGRVRPHGRRHHALAVLRAAARPQPALRLRAGARDQEEAPHALELGPLPRGLREHPGLRAELRRPRRAAARRRRRALDRWLVARTQQYVARGDPGARRPADVPPRGGFDEFVDESPTGTSAARAAGSGTGTRRRSASSGTRSSRAARSRPSCRSWASTLAEPRRRAVRGAPESIFLAGWPSRASSPPRCSSRSREVRAVVELGRRARTRPASSSGSPSGSSVSRGRSGRRARDEIAEELRVKAVEFGELRRPTYGRSPT